MATGQGVDSRKVVLAALAGNVGIAAAKFVAAFASDSVTMLAEAVHSVADSTNQALLLLGMALASRRDPELYQLGRHKESYFWAFIASLFLFFMGGAYAIREGLHKLTHKGEPPSSLLLQLVVLVVSIAFESASFWVAAREFQKARKGRTLSAVLFGGKDPTIPLVLLEDAGALVGLVIALAAVLTSHFSVSTLADSAGSIVIGLLLCTIGMLLARDTHSLLIGEAATPEMRKKAIELAQGTEGVERVTQLLTMHLGPEAVLAAFKVRFRAGITVEEVERVTDALEARVRAEIPDMRRIFVEADGDYTSRPPAKD
ncbi:MAG TPA: cation diffusion facilitator family transporter [Polyangiaceae bacterium]